VQLITPAVEVAEKYPVEQVKAPDEVQVAIPVPHETQVPTEI